MLLRAERQRCEVVRDILEKKIVGFRQRIPSARLFGVKSASAAHRFGYTATGKVCNGCRETVDAGLPRFFNDAAMRFGNHASGLSGGQGKNRPAASHVHENFG